MIYLLPGIIVFPMVMAFICYAVGKRSSRTRSMLAIAAAAVELLLTIVLLFSDNLNAAESGLCGLDIRLELDGFRKVYCAVAAFMWLMTLLMSDEYLHHSHPRGRYYFFTLMTLGATMGVFLAGDLYTAFIAFEIMSFTSYVWVVQEESPAAIRAGDTYLAVAVIGGLAALMGLFLLQHLLGTTQISRLYELGKLCKNKTELYVAGGCILFGFGAKAGMFPLHIWLPKAHPVAPAPASALLSGILTKAGIFGILAITCNLFRYDAAWGTAVLALGTVTMVLGAVLALFSVDLKRTLACSSVSQIGFILVGIGMMGLLGKENALAAQGTLLHMVNHSLFKLVLFMAAGVVFMNLHELNLNEIRGFGRKKHMLKFVFLMGALGIGGIPLWSGYISKTLLHESITAYIAIQRAAGAAVWPMKCVEWLFLLTGGLTLAYMAKLYVALFIEKHPTRQAEFDAKEECCKPSTTIALMLPALLLPLLGMTAGFSMDKLAEFGTDFFHSGARTEAVRYISWSSLSGALISVLIGAVVYVLVVRGWMRKREHGVMVYVNRWPQWLDLEELLYRPLLLKWLPGILGWIGALFGENRVTEPLCKGVFRALGVAFHAVCDLPDALVLAVRRGFYRPAREKNEDKVTNTLSYRLGADVDAVAIRHGKEEKGGSRYADLFFRSGKTVRDTGRRITGNLSFALLMLCLAVCFVFIYMMILHR